MLPRSFHPELQLLMRAVCIVTRSTTTTETRKHTTRFWKQKTWTNLPLQINRVLKRFLKATDSPTMNLFRSRPMMWVNYQLEKADLESLYNVAKAAGRVALLESADKKFDVAKKYYSAIFALGVNLFRERIVYDELSKGEDLMGTGAGGLRRIAERNNDNMKALELKNWDGDRVTDFKANIEPVWSVISTIDPGSIATHAGDIFELAGDKTADHLWRVEATLKVGRLKYNAAKSGDQLLAKKFLRDLAADAAEDPAVHAAAVKARDLTLEDYRNLR